MKKLSIFDDNILIATITQIDSGILIFARSSREWSEMKRLSTYVDLKNKKYLKKLAEKAHEFNYSTEFSNE
jgi:hypothetical protein